jgi:ketosteroid isomerase-like protein
MSEEFTTPQLEEAYRKIIDALNRRDFATVFQIWGPEPVWDTTPADGLLGVYEGPEAIRRAIEDWIGPYTDWEQEVEEFRDVGNGVGFGVTIQRGRLAGSSRVVVLRFANVMTWDDGLVARSTSYTDFDEARAAAERLAEERG